MLLVFCPACATKALWETTAPETRTWIESNRFTPEECADYCAKRGLEYETFSNGYLVDKTPQHKRADVAIRAVGTPFALAVDAATGATIVGAYLLLCCPDFWAELVACACNSQ